MSRLESLKVLIHERLTAAVEDIIGQVERTINEYEEEVKSRHRQLLESKPEENLRRTVLSSEVQQPLVIKEEQQEWSFSLEQPHPEHLHIKEEQEESWSRHEGEQLHEERAKSRVKSGDDEEKLPSSQFHHRQTEDNREAQAPASSSTQLMKTENDGQAGSGFKCLSTSEAATEGYGDDGKHQTDVNTVGTKAPVNDLGHNTANKSFSCSKCGKRFGQKHHLQTHMRCHTGEKPFSCSLCAKRFSQKGNLTQHLTVHTREKPCSCPVCGERFAQQGNLTQHMTVHTREKTLLVRDRLKVPERRELQYDDMLS